MAHMPSAQPLDQADPHHELPHHGHVIIRPSTLIAVLATLLFFTVATVAASRAEIWIANTFEVHIPQIVNVLIALSIATVKTILVVMFFMQLKYDNPLNSIVFLFCLFAFALFLFFSMTDLGTRGAVYSYKASEVQAGGMGISTEREITMPDGSKTTRGVNTGGKGIVAWARQRRIEQIGQLAAEGRLNPPLEPGELPEARYEKEWAKFQHQEHGHAEAPRSTANRYVPPAPGTTPDLFTEKPAAGHGQDAHGH